MNAVIHQAFDISERAKCAITRDDFALPSEWYQHGTQLRGTLRLRAVDYLVEVETGVSGCEIDQGFTSVGIFDATNHYVQEVDEMVHVYGLLRDAATAEVQRRAVELREAHEEARAEERADDARDFEQGIGC